MVAALGLEVPSVAETHEGNEVPGNYPSHAATARCGDLKSVNLLGEELNQYNLIRVRIGHVLRILAEDYNLDGPARERLLGFADNFDDMGRHMPPADPDSDTFRNFDFRLGIAFSALTVFLHTGSDELAQRFYRDRDNPDSVLGRYLAELTERRETYMTSLKAAKAGGGKGMCS